MNIFMSQNIRQFIKGVIQKKQDWTEMTKYRVPCQHDVPEVINTVYEDIFGYKTDGFFVEVGVLTAKIQASRATWQTLAGRGITSNRLRNIS